VRTGAKLARVEAVFEIPEDSARTGLRETLGELGAEPEEGTIVLGREVLASGRSSARINGRLSTAGNLARVGELLVDIHGQSDHLSLLRATEQMAMLDRAAGLDQHRMEVARLVREWRTLKQTISEIATSGRERAQRVDFLRFQLTEILGAELRIGEEEELLTERTLRLNATRLASEAEAARLFLAGQDEVAGTETLMPALAALRHANDHLRAVVAIDTAVEPLADRLYEVVVLTEELAAEVRAYGEAIEPDSARLTVVEDRLDDLKALKRKYGATVAEVIEAGSAAAAELEVMTGGAGDLELLRERATVLGQEIGRRAGDLSAARRAVGVELARGVEATIAELNMGRARFEVEITQREEAEGVPVPKQGGEQQWLAVDVTGVDRVEFMVAPNAGEALKPLARVASGGETARLMLALKSILAEADATPTLVFDEVDAGVGGRSGQVVGEKLRRLADHHQVVVITHLPQIAAFAEAHYRISKGVRQGRVVSQVEPLSVAERVEELATMLDGVPVTAAALASAREMLGRVETWKRTVPGQVAG